MGKFFLELSNKSADKKLIEFLIVLDCKQVPVFKLQYRVTVIYLLHFHLPKEHNVFFKHLKYIFSFFMQYPRI